MTDPILSLNEERREQINQTIKNIAKGEISVLDLVEQMGDKLTSREAETRKNAINELCAISLKLGKENGNIFNKSESASLLNFMLSKLEDSGHLSELLISTIHFLLINNYDGMEKFLQNDQLEYILTTLFANNNAQSYGQKDRIILYSILEFLLNTHSKELLSPIAQHQKTIQYFLGSVQGEQDPRVLIIIFKIHQKLANQSKLGIFLEDMFDIISCYFPIDYEPDENDQKCPPITAEMLRRGLEDCLFANNSFAPFCFHLICEKMADNDIEGVDGNSIKRQLDICKFFINACKHFENIGKILEQNLDDLMTSIRSIYLNPAQNQRMLNETSKIIKSTMQVLVKGLSDYENGIEYVQGIEGKMVEMTIENIEPFILQAEMGTMGNGFELLKCLAESGIGAKSVQKIVQRCLYWLNLLVNGQTLRSPQNHREIALEAIALVPYWFQLEIFQINQQQQQIVGVSDDENLIIAQTTIFPLLDGIFLIGDEFVENDELIELKCRVLTPLLLSFCNESVNNNFFKGNEKFMEFCCQIFQKICNKMEEQLFPQDDINQFLALYATFCSDQINGQFFMDCLKKGHKIINILSPIVCPFPTELEGRNIPAEMFQKTLENSKRAMNAILTISFEQIFSINRNKIHIDAIQGINKCCREIENTSKRLNINIFDGNNSFLVLVDEFYNGMKKQIHKLLSQIDNHKNSLEEEGQSKTTTIFDSIGLLLQNIGSNLRKNNLDHLHEELCDWAMGNIKSSSIINKLTNFRTFWLLLIQSKNFKYQNDFIEEILLYNSMQIIHHQSAENCPSSTYFDLIFLEQSLCAFYFAIYNHQQILGEGKEESSKRNKIKFSIAKLVQARSQCEFEQQNIPQFQAEKRGNGLLLSNIQYFTHFPYFTINQSLAGKSGIIYDDENVAKMAANFRMELLEMRSKLLLANSNKTITIDELKKFFDKILSMEELLFPPTTMEQLLDFSNPAIDPEKCFYKKSLFWQQRIFSIFVPIFVDYFGHAKEYKKFQLLTLIGPLMEILAKIPTMDSLTDELILLGPLIVKSLPLTICENIDNSAGQYSSSLQLSILDGLCLLLKKQRLDQNTTFSNNEGGGGSHFNQGILQSIVICLSKSFCHGNLPPQIIVKTLECLQIVAHQFGHSHREWLAPLYIPVIRSLAQMSSNRKRFIRQKSANTRNSWEFII